MRQGLGHVAAAIGSRVGEATDVLISDRLVRPGLSFGRLGKASAAARKEVDER
jgi:hypothetical protein